MTLIDHTHILDALRARIAAAGVDGFLIPRADRHLGEYVPASDARLGFATGFTGSAGLAYVDADQAALFVDGRYELQAAAQAEPRGFKIVATRETSLRDWLLENAPSGGRIGYDAWLHSAETVGSLEDAAASRGASLVALAANPLDQVWREGRPSSPSTPVVAHIERYAGESAASKRARVAADLREAGLDAAVLTAPDSICWLLNIRAHDVEHKPLVLAYAVLRADGAVALFTNAARVGADARAHLGDAVSLEDWSGFEPALRALSGLKVSVDRVRSPAAVALALDAAGAARVSADDPCLGPKARKNTVELDGARAAQKRDGAAMATALTWLDRTVDDGGLDELTVAETLTRIRAETAARLGEPLQGESFPPIVGFGPNGAVIHYRVTPQTSLTIAGDDLILIDSGGQYFDGTTDVTRTVAVGAPDETRRRVFTLVLKGMIAMSRLRFPPRTSGQRIDALARAALWAEGLDYDHGTGHGVGSYLGVHEGPQGISARSAVPLEPGMILSNEPGCYQAGGFGVRIENLVVVTEPSGVQGGLGDREMCGFETLTLIPIDRRLIDLALLEPGERAWLDAYHARVLAEIGPLVEDDVRAWLERVCAPL